MIIRKNGRLYLDAVNNTPLAVFGELLNKGRIYCTPTIPVSPNVHIGADGYFEQTSTGKLYCYDFELLCIAIYGTFNNNGLVEVYGDDYGEDGIVVYGGGHFINGSAAWLHLNDVTGNALSSTQDGIIDNHGRIFIKGDNAYYAVLVAGGQFTNYNYMLVQDGSAAGLRVSTGKVFRNEGEVNLAGSDDVGLWVFGTFINTSGADLKVQNTGGTGINVYVAGTLENQGTATVFGSIGNHALVNYNTIVNEGDFSVLSSSPAGYSQIISDGFIENQVCGYFYHTGTYAGFSNDQILNEGFWQTYATNASSNDGLLENFGVFSDPHGSFGSLVTMTNYGHKIGSITGPYCINETVPNILEIGSSPNLSINDWYASSKYFIIAGTYDAVNNAFTIDPASGGLEFLYIEFEHSDGCTNRMAIRFDPYIQEGIELCGDGIDNDCDGLIDEAGCLAPQFPDNSDLELDERTPQEFDETSPTLFPNPGNGALELQWADEPTSPFLIEIFHLDGKLAWTGQGNRIQTDLPAGIYLVRVTTEAQVHPVQKWVVQ